MKVEHLDDESIIAEATALKSFFSYNKKLKLTERLNSFVTETQSEICSPILNLVVKLLVEL